MEAFENFLTGSDIFDNKRFKDLKNANDNEILTAKKTRSIDVASDELMVSFRIWTEETI